jgi:hypothetical protein
VLRLLACTGLRQREASEMSWQEIKGNLLVLPGSRTKNKHEHRFPLSSLALDVIASVPRVESLTCPYVFSSGKVPVNSWDLPKRRTSGRVLLFGRMVLAFTNSASKLRNGYNRAALRGHWLMRFPNLLRFSFIGVKLSTRRGLHHQ